MTAAEPIEFTESSGNVFADLGLPDADELYAKATLSLIIARMIRDRGLTQAEAAKLLGTTQPKISELVRGRLAGFSMERLFRYLNALGMNVRIHVSEAESRKEPAQTVVEVR
jgi:predicted XRE-type DNA-binding protein